MANYSNINSENDSEMLVRILQFILYFRNKLQNTEYYISDFCGLCGKIPGRNPA